MVTFSFLWEIYYPSLITIVKMGVKLFTLAWKMLLPLMVTFNLVVSFSSLWDIYHPSLVTIGHMGAKLWAIIETCSKNLTLASKRSLTSGGDLWPCGDIHLTMRHLPPKFGPNWANGCKVMGHNRNLLKKLKVGLKKDIDPCWWPLTLWWPLHTSNFVSLYDQSSIQVWLKLEHLPLSYSRF